MEIAVFPSKNPKNKPFIIFFYQFSALLSAARRNALPFHRGHSNHLRADESASS
jgi:hypothetical protein